MPTHNSDTDACPICSAHPLTPLCGPGCFARHTADCCIVSDMERVRLIINHLNQVFSDGWSTVNCADILDNNERLSEAVYQLKRKWDGPARA